MRTLHSYEQLGRQVEAVMELVRHFQKELRVPQRTLSLKGSVRRFGGNILVCFLSKSLIRRSIPLSYLYAKYEAIARSRRADLSLKIEKRWKWPRKGPTSTSNYQVV